MQIFVKATNVGKNIRVLDRIANQEVFNKYLDLDGQESISVASPDGKTGSLDIYYGLGGVANIVFETDFEVTKGLVIEVDAT